MKTVFITNVGKGNAVQALAKFEKSGFAGISRPGSLAYSADDLSAVEIVQRKGIENMRDPKISKM